jgi:hypothetical protein
VHTLLVRLRPREHARDEKEASSSVTSTTTRNSSGTLGAIKLQFALSEQ